MVEMWECQFKYNQNINFDLFEYVQSLDFVTPLDPRDAFLGGRTEMFRKYCAATGKSVIRSYDANSLYPYICKYGEFPTGHPNIFIKDFPDSLENMTGFIKMIVLAPKNLYLPLLGMKINGKLIFGLCRLCMLTGNTGECSHSVSERALEGTFVIHEVRKALTLGYEILKIYEIWDYIPTQFDGVSGGIFVEYINLFLKIKQEASGFPSWVTTDEDKQAYIDQMKARDNIELDIDAIEYNPGLRSLAKMALNSLW